MRSCALVRTGGCAIPDPRQESDRRPFPVQYWSLMRYRCFHCCCDAAVKRKWSTGWLNQRSSYSSALAQPPTSAVTIIANAACSRIGRHGNRRVDGIDYPCVTCMYTRVCLGLFLSVHVFIPIDPKGAIWSHYSKSRNIYSFGTSHPVKPTDVEPTNF